MFTRDLRYHGPMPRPGANQVSVVEAAYLPARSDTEWLQEIATIAEPVISEGFGALAYIYEGAQGPLRMGARAGWGLAFPVDVFVDPVATMDPAFVDRTWRSLSFGLCSESVPLEHLPGAGALLAHGIQDVVNVNAYDPSGIGIMLAAPLPEQRRRKPGEAERWTRVAAHLASAFRLRRREVDPSPDTATAVLDTRGRVQHAANGETADRLHQKLEQAVLRMEAARGPMRRRDPDGALELWRTLVDAELTLLDHFERGGKRYVVAVANPPKLEEDKRPLLSRRERQVVSAAAAGRTNKLIAYELGLAHSTVRVLLARAAQRLGASSRRELIAIQRAHQRARRKRAR
jgi:DNA-binding CsgD family transcriptional regulator